MTYVAMVEQLLRTLHDPDFHHWLLRRWRQQRAHQPCDGCDHIRRLGGIQPCPRCGLSFCIPCRRDHRLQQERDYPDDCGAFVEEHARIAAAIRTNRMFAKPNDGDYAMARQAWREGR